MDKTEQQTKRQGSSENPQYQTMGDQKHTLFGPPFESITGTKICSDIGVDNGRSHCDLPLRKAGTQLTGASESEILIPVTLISEPQDDNKAARTLKIGQSHRSYQQRGWKRIFDEFEPPPIPEELFHQGRSSTLPKTGTESSSHGYTAVGIDPASRSEHSKTDHYNVLKEIEAAQRTSWQAKKRPRLESKAYWFWDQAHDKDDMQEHCRKSIVRLQKRLDSLEQEISGNASVRDVKRLAEALQPTVEDIAAWEWKLELYGQMQAPEKPIVAQPFERTQKRKAEVLDDDVDLSGEEDWEGYEDEEDGEDAGPIVDDDNDDGWIEYDDKSCTGLDVEMVVIEE